MHSPWLVGVGTLSVVVAPSWSRARVSRDSAGREPWLDRSTVTVVVGLCSAAVMDGSLPSRPAGHFGFAL